MIRLSLRKGCALTIILLILGLAFLPTINANQYIKNIDDDIIEFPVEIYRINSKEIHTVKIHKDEVKEIQQLLNDIEHQLKMIKSHDEAVIVFRRAVSQLYEHGFFPKDMGLEEAQQLVNGRRDIHKITKFFDKIYSKDKSIIKNFNIFCRVGGMVETPTFLGIFWGLFFTVFHFWYEFVQSLMPYYLYWFFPFFLLFAPLAEMMYMSPFHFGQAVYIGDKDVDAVPGWVNAIGLLGIRQWEGQLWGSIPINTPFGLWDHPAILGFVGIKMVKNFVPPWDNFLFLGFSLCVGIEEK
jgi:hypothetical protein